jgi:cob(I)alamin adenosyltransferase
MMLYTRKGDKGDTQFFGSKKRISKNSCQTEALGVIDELNSILGVCRAKSDKSDIEILDKPISKILEKIQQDLFVIQAVLAGADERIKEENVKFLEEIVDAIEKEFPKIKSFLLPGATELSSYIDYARAVSRRAERRIVAHSEKEGSVTSEILQYLNRLSSLLYALVRIVNFKSGAEEIPPTY